MIATGVNGRKDFDTPTISDKEIRGGDCVVAGRSRPESELMGFDEWGCTGSGRREIEANQQPAVPSTD